MFGFLYTSYHCTAYAPKTAYSGVLLPVMYFLLYGFLRGLQIFFVRPDTYFTTLPPFISLPTVTFARYLPSLCFAIVKYLPLC